MENKDKGRNNRRCIILCCNSSSLKDRNLKFFRFPMPDTPDYQIWLSACKDSYNQIRVLKKPLICNLHFAPEDVGGRRLNPGAYPKLRLTAKRDAIDPQARQEKIKFLNDVMMEWIIRNRPYRDIYGKLLIEKAREARELLDIPSYMPDKSWLKNFNEEIAQPQSRLYEMNACGKSVRMSDIIRELRQQEETQSYNYSGAENSIEISDDDDDDYDDGDFSDSYADLSSKLEVSVTVDGEIDYYEPSTKMPKIQSISLDLDEVEANENKKQNIGSYKDALTFLKPLEDFALQMEDFRVIGLLAQLEAIFKLQQQQQ